MKEPTHDNDNEKLSFITLRAATLNVIRYLEEKQQDDRERDAQRDGQNEHDAEQHRRTVERRLHELAKFERRANGK